MASNTLSLFSIYPCSNCRFSSRNPSASSSLSLHSSSSLLGYRLSIPCLDSRRLVSKHLQSIVATIVFSLPSTTKPGQTSPENPPKWSARAIKSFAMAELEARKLKYPNTGTEALLMGILVEGTSIAAKFLREHGITLFKVREETVNLLGKSDMYIFSPEHPPLTEPSKRALDWAVDEKLKSGEDGEITSAHLLLGIWSERESAGHQIMAAFGFDGEKAKELAKSMSKDIILNFK